MIRRYLVIFLILFSSQTTFAQIKDYEFIFLKTIPVGEEPGMIGWNALASGGGYPGPFTFSISFDNKVYVPDYVNTRINIYDIGLNYLTTVIEKEERLKAWVKVIRVDRNQNIILLKSYELKKIDNEGNTIFRINESELSDEVMSRRNFFILENHIFFYDEHGYVRSIDPEGNIQKPGRSMEVLNEINQRQMGTESQAQDSSVSRASIGEVQVPSVILQDRKHIIVGGQFLSTDRDRVGKYYEELEKENASVRSFNTETSRGFDIDISGIRSRYLQGYDNDHNSYWIGVESSTRKQLVIIYSNTGTILDAFYYDDINEMKANNIQSRKVAIAPNGDVFFMRNDEKGSHFWKVERRW